MNIVFSHRPWTVKEFNRRRLDDFILSTNEADLTLAFIDEINPRYIFFPDWSKRIPSDIASKYECIAFHESNLPYGRGGSPVQNLIARGHTETMVCSFRVTDEIDAGNIYCKTRLSLLGSAEEIYIRSAAIIFDQIEQITNGKELLPHKQYGEVVVFPRRTPAESEIPNEVDLKSIYDFIRMLDAEGYPKAFIRHGLHRIELKNAVLRHDGIDAIVKITKE